MKLTRTISLLLLASYFGRILYAVWLTHHVAPQCDPGDVVRSYHALAIYLIGAISYAGLSAWQWTGFRGWPEV